ncbi:MAG: hypothetical protein JRI68_33185, partial [Deltaproteobacteria bacterium]|nr:hypothetical protein [Deltaproteobacteria bacterium]
ERDVGRKRIAVIGTTLGLSLLFYFASSHPVWPLIGPTLLIGLLMVAPSLSSGGGSVISWLGSRSLPFWIFLWFLLSSVALTVIGVLFRGPGWDYVLPWRDGIY